MTASPSLGTGSLIFGWSDHGALTAVILETVDTGMPVGPVEVTVEAVWVEDPDRLRGRVRAAHMPVVRLTGRGRAAVELLADPLPRPVVRAGGRP